MTCDSSNRLQYYYSHNSEESRLASATGQLEFLRSQEIILRYLPPPPAVIIDVGGAAGVYSCWLARIGYEVHLVDIVAGLVSQALEASSRQPNTPIASCRIGDARKLEFPDRFADAVLMFGPLYHLTDRQDRLTALEQACRVLKSGGVLFAAGISRFASAIDGLVHGFVTDDEFRKIMEQDLRNGQHRNHTSRIEYFTDAFFHEPAELQSEVLEAGFGDPQVLPIEGVGQLLNNLDWYMQDEERMNGLFSVLRSLETSSALSGATSHLMCIAIKP
jgi:ubiquinone/menaquinone biosynthesis C-methylase UbiE